MDILAITIIVLCLVIGQIIFERARERSRDQDAVLMRLIQYGKR